MIRVPLWIQKKTDCSSPGHKDTSLLKQSCFPLGGMRLLSLYKYECRDGHNVSYLFLIILSFADAGKPFLSMLEILLAHLFVQQQLDLHAMGQRR